MSLEPTEEETRLLKLSDEDSKAVADALSENDPRPNEALQRASKQFDRYKKEDA
jgi:uncharacterized protein (DUF1778 family)